MRVALVVPELTSDVSANLRGMKAALIRAAETGARLVVFPEATLTGLISNGDPHHDLPLGQTIPGPATEELGAMCVRLQVYLQLAADLCVTPKPPSPRSPSSQLCVSSNQVSALALLSRSARSRPSSSLTPGSHAVQS